MNNFLSKPPQGTNVIIPILTGETIDASLNTISNTGILTVYTIYLSGTTVKARNNVTGVIDYTADNTVDAVTAINSAINNIKNIAGVDATYGATIHISHGTYKCVTNLLLDYTIAGRSGIRLTGEGAGTVLNFIPGSALTTAITISSIFSGLSNIRIVANSNVTNYVRLKSATNTVAWDGSRGKIEFVIFEGPNYGGSYAPVTGQVGILEDGTAAGTPYFWRIWGCDFNSVDTGIKSVGTSGTSLFIQGDGFFSCTYGIDLAGPEHTVDNCWVQGNGQGIYGVRLRGTTSNNIVSNILGEMTLTVGTASMVILDSGAIKNVVTNIMDASEDFVHNFTVIDNAVNGTNYIQYSSIHDSSVIVNGSVTNTGTQTFNGTVTVIAPGALVLRNNILILQNPALTFNYTLTTGAITAARNITLPAITADALFMMSMSQNTGAVTATLGTNAPAGVATTPYTWLKMISNDGSTVYVPAFK